jgi:hypothetical protein
MWEWAVLWYQFLFSSSLVLGAVSLPGLVLWVRLCRLLCLPLFLAVRVSKQGRPAPAMLQAQGIIWPSVLCLRCNVLYSSRTVWA